MIRPSAQQERIVPRFIEQEMRESFIDYSMSVIVQRALPDARDGLKPVHRRILHAMHELGLRPERDHKKSATVVGEVLGKYHPHGDAAVYDALVRMVQDFSLRYPLIDGQGNFGSIDGDSAAAYRYTEARLAPIAMELLADLDRDTVDFVPNFDGRLREPVVLPAALPHLLLNGSDGIAVGMATKIPPHNLGELLAAAIHLVRRPECRVEELMRRLPGPDFPTGGYIWGREGIEEAYRTGRGLVEMRARMHVEEGSYGKSALVVTELPYQVNKTRVIEQITRMVREGKGGAISDLRDESDRDGVRLVIELKRDADPRKLVKALFVKTQLRCTFGVIMLALVDGRPEQLDLKSALEAFVTHRLDVIVRRASFDLARALDRAHVLDGLLRALDEIDRVIELIRGSRNPESAKGKLRRELKLSERQAEAILAMRLARLTALERRSLAEEREELRDRIAELEELVDDERARRSLLEKELRDLVARYGDDRRTEILDGVGKFPLPAGAGAEASLVLVTRRGYVKSLPVRSGTGLAGADAMAAREGDFVTQAFVARGTDQLLLFTAGGAVHALAVGDLPRGTRSSRGHALAELAGIGRGDAVVSAIVVDRFEPGRFVLFATRDAQVKRTGLEEYANVRGGGIIATGLAEGDAVLAALLTDDSAELLLATRAGQAIRFPEAEIRSMGRAARGVRGIELPDGDALVAALAPRRDADLIAATSRGYGKRIPFTEFRVQGRAGKGTPILPERETTGELVGLVEVHPGDRVMWEMESGELVAVEARAILEKARREASARVREVEEAGGGVVAVHPLRAAPQRVAGEGAAAAPAGAESGVEAENGGEAEDAAGGGAGAGSGLRRRAGHGAPADEGPQSELDLADG